LRPEEALAPLAELVGDRDRVVVDLGDNTIAAAKAGLDPDGGTGALGGAIAVALGHCLRTEGRVYCVVGDGGFFMHLHTLATIAQNRDRFENLTIVVVTDAAWGMTGGQENPATEASPAEVAESLGLKPTGVATDVDEAERLLNRCARSGPSLAELRCDPMTYL
jgi:thiamine pyrophosphate-dependent acetolactate synthase large subunit-like protein